jgi:hypothetical protein
LAGLDLRAFDRIAEQVATQQAGGRVVDANAPVVMGLDVVASTPSVPAVGAAPTETVNSLVSIHTHQPGPFQPALYEQ